MKALLLAACLVSAACAAAPVDGARVDVMQQRAAAGDREAQFALGLKHRNGIGMPPDATAAHSLVRKAAEGGHPAAMFTLSNMLAQGEGTAQDVPAAQRWVRAAAELDYPEALQHLALQESDPVKAAQLMRAAAHALKHRAHGH